MIDAPTTDVLPFVQSPPSSPKTDAEQDRASFGSMLREETAAARSDQGAVAQGHHRSQQAPSATDHDAPVTDEKSPKRKNAEANRTADGEANNAAADKPGAGTPNSGSLIGSPENARIKSKIIGESADPDIADAQHKKKSMSQGTSGDLDLTPSKTANVKTRGSLHDAQNDGPVALSQQNAAQASTPNLGATAAVNSHAPSSQNPNASQSVPAASGQSNTTKQESQNTPHLRAGGSTGHGAVNQKTSEGMANAATVPASGSHAATRPAQAQSAPPEKAVSGPANQGQAGNETSEAAMANSAKPAPNADPKQMVSPQEASIKAASGAVSDTPNLRMAPVSADATAQKKSVYGKALSASVEGSTKVAGTPSTDTPASGRSGNALPTDTGAETIQGVEKSKAQFALDETAHKKRSAPDPKGASVLKDNKTTNEATAALGQIAKAEPQESAAKTQPQITPDTAQLMAQTAKTQGETTTATQPMPRESAPDLPLNAGPQPATTTESSHPSLRLAGHSEALPHNTAHAQTAAKDIAVHMARHQAGGVNRFEIRLDPPEMGRVDIKMEITQDGRVQAVLSAERPEALDLLRGDAKALERALNEAGLKADSNSLSFSLRDESGRGAENRNGDGQNGFGNQPGDEASLSDDSATSDVVHLSVPPGMEISEDVYGMRVTTRAGVNIEI